MRSLKQAGILNWPNIITVGRFIAVPLLIVMLFSLAKQKSELLLSLSAAGIFIIAMISDMVDGYLARRWDIMSTFGKFLDPLADKILFLSTMIMMIPLGRIPAWIVVIFCLREFVVTALRSVAVDEGIVIAASKWGKYKSAFISSATIALLIHYPFFGVEWRLIGWVLMWPALLLSFISGFDYCWCFYKTIKAKASA